MSTQPPVTDQSRYVQLPNGSYMEWPQGVSAEEFKAKAQKVSASPDQPKPENFLHSLGSSLGLTPEQLQAQAQERMDHTIASGLKSLLGPAEPMIEGAVAGAKRIGGEIGKGNQSAKEGNVAGLAQHAITALPFVGPALDKGADQYAEGNYAGEAGTLLGGAAQAAPLAEGAVNGGLTDMVPSRARAGASFESLNQDLAQHPVPLNATLKPLQRVTEIGERGSQLPTAVNKLLQRSQSPIPMTFPEARDYQASLSDLSSSDKLAMNGRVRGGVAQLNKALFQDIQDAAEGAGRGEDYAKAMKEYRQASTLKDVATKAAKFGAGAAATGAGLGLAHRFFTTISER